VPEGLRERKKARTRHAIQASALALFRRQGYDATTVEQILDAADVSETTFYRYFPTKKDLVLTDEYDPAFAAAVRAQPAGLSALQAITVSIHDLLDGLSSGESAELRDRLTLILTTPELRAAMLDQLTDAIRLLTELVAERVGRPVADPAARALAGAVIGATMTALLALADDPAADIVELVDEALAHLEPALKL
jgi:AcrR family transcriptional regulator